MVQEVAFVDGVGDVYDTISATFGVVSASGWPAADTGQPWTVSSTSECTSSGGQGLMSLAAVGTSRTARLTTPGSDQVVYGEVTVPVVPTGASITARAVGRMGAGGFTDYYQVWLIIATSGAATMKISKVVSSAATDLTSTVSCGTHAAGNTWALRLRIVGQHIWAKVWNKTTGSEPTAWQALATDTDLTSGAEAGVLSRLETGNTNTLPVLISWDNFSVTSPVQKRLDLHDLTHYVTMSATDWGMPNFDEAVVESLMSDDPVVPAAAFSGRTLQLAIDMPEATADTVASRFQAFVRELQRPTNIIRYVAPGTTQPVFFRTYRASPSAVRWNSLHQVTVPIRAKSAAVGKRVDLAPVTVNNDPAAVSNPQYFDVTGIQGDIETPPLIRITNGVAPFTGGVLSSVLAVRRRGTPSQAPGPLQCESMALGTDTTLPGNDATMSGSGSNYARCSFGTPGMTTRLTIGNFPTSILADSRGRYNVWLRNRQNTGGDVIKARLGVGYPGGIGSNIFNDTVTLPSTNNLRWSNLGELNLPIFADPGQDGQSGVDMPILGVSLAIQVERASGAGTFDMDCLAFVPADDRSSLVTWTVVFSPAPSYVLADSVHDQVYPLDAGGIMHSNHQPIVRDGFLPMLSPGVTNRVHLLLNACPAGVINQPDDKAHTATVQVSYWPQYIYVRPVGS